MTLQQMVDAATAAGLHGKPLPDFGSGLSSTSLLAINSAYNEARNYHASKRK